MRVLRALPAALALALLVSCDSSPVEAPGVTDASLNSAGVSAIVTGGGQFDVALAVGSFIGTFGFGAVAGPGGQASGQLHFRLDLGAPIEFHGVVTCVSVDRARGRAWIGGVVTQNRSEHPSYTTPRTQVGRDIWFRVLDNGEGPVLDRTTFVGFEGDRNIITSQEYCDSQPWVDDPPNASTWAVINGNLSIR